MTASERSQPVPHGKTHISTSADALLPIPAPGVCCLSLNNLRYLVQCNRRNDAAQVQILEAPKDARGEGGGSHGRCEGGRFAGGLDCDIQCEYVLLLRAIRIPASLVLCVVPVSACMYVVRICGQF